MIICRWMSHLSVYNPNKPAKYGLLFKSINASRFSYTFVAAAYCRKPVDEDNNRYYIQGTEHVVIDLVQNVEAETTIKRRNIFHLTVCLDSFS